MRQILAITFLIFTCHHLLVGRVIEKPEYRPGKDYAILFAVNNYKAPLTNLTNPIANARNIASELENRFGFRPQVIENPTSAQIEQTLTDYANRFARNLDNQYPGDGQLFIFFSGHGTERLENGYFLPSDADLNNLRQTGLSYNYLRPLINEIKCQHILVAVDACYSLSFDENFRKRSDSDFRRPGELTDNQKVLLNHTRFKSRVFFTSDAIGDMTPDKSGFAKKLLEGLRSAEPSSGFMTSSELFANYIEKASPIPHGGEFGSDEAGATFLFFRQNVESNLNHLNDLGAWNQANKINTIDSYKMYLQNFANGEFLNLANQKIEELSTKEKDHTEWENAKSLNSKMAYERYLQLFPDGDYAGIAKLNIQKKATLIIEEDFEDPLLGKMIFVKGGIFSMGNPDDTYDETPVHKVRVNDFYIGQFEITIDQWRTIMKKKYKGYHDCENCPMDYISWIEVQKFIKKVNKITSKNYRLPTEAEWEYAAKGGTKTLGFKFSGSDNISEIARWYLTSSHANPQAVGMFKPNELGIYDMTGNLWEWCQDIYDPKYYKNSPSDNPKGPSDGNYRVTRGGYYWSHSSDATVTERNYTSEKSGRNSDIGFRLVLSLADIKK